MKWEKTVPLTLALCVVLAVLAIIPPLTWPECVALAVALVVHYARELIPEKRDVTPARADDLEVVANTVKDLQSKVNSITLAMGIKGFHEKR